MAHHEPILSENPPDMLSAIAKLIDLRCQTTAQWMRHHATVDKIIRTRPTPQGRSIQDLASRLDKNFRAVCPDMNLARVFDSTGRSAAAIVCLGADDTPAAAFTKEDVADFICNRSQEAGGLVDLSDWSVQNLIDHLTPDRSWKPLPGPTPLSEAIGDLRKPGMRLLVGTDPTTGRPTGVIKRAHRRY